MAGNGPSRPATPPPPPPVMDYQRMAAMERDQRAQMEAMSREQREQMEAQLAQLQESRRQDQEREEARYRKEEERKEREQDKREREQREWQQNQMELQMRLMEQSQAANAEMRRMQERSSEQMAQVQQQHMEQIARLSESNQANLAALMAELRSSGGSEMKKLEDDLLALEKELNEAKKRADEDANPELYEEVQANRFDNFLSCVLQTPDPPKRPKRSLAIMGRRGTGKSSTCNAIVGSEVAITGVKDTTKEVTLVYGLCPDHNFEVWDVPGETDARSYSNLETLVKMKQMHLIILLYTDGVDNVLNMVRLVSACKVPYIVIRNKVDAIQEDDAQKAGMPLEQLVEKTRQDEEDTLNEFMARKVPGSDPVHIYFTSSKKFPYVGIQEVKDRIAEMIQFEFTA